MLAEETKLPILSFSSSHSFFFKYKDFVGSVPLLSFSNPAIVPSNLYLSGLVVSESRSLLFFTEKDKIKHEYTIDTKTSLNTTNVAEIINGKKNSLVKEYIIHLDKTRSDVML
jgi:hypothetical protein